MVVARLGGMGSKLVWAGVAVVTLVAAVVLLRNPAPPPAPPAPVRAEVAIGVTGDWRYVRPIGDDVHRMFVDGDRVLDANGLLGSRAIRRTADVLSIEDNGVELSSAGHVPSGPFAVTPKALVLQDGARCLEIVDPVTLAERSRHCAPEKAEISLLSEEPDGAQWRETEQGAECASWYRLGDDLAPQRLSVGGPACRSAVLVRADGWEVTADFPPYQMGVAHPGPLVAHKDGNEIILDSSAVDIQACAGEVYWLRNSAGRHFLLRWRPGETKIIETALAGAEAVRCVNGMLNVVSPVGVFLPKQR